MNRKEIFKIERGIYADKPHVSPFSILYKKYPEGILTLDTAYFIHGLTDVVPTKIYFATRRNATRLSNPSIIQVYSDDRFLDAGKTNMLYEGEPIQIYNLERLLVEVMRCSRSMALDYYKEIIISFRKCINQLDIHRVEEYIMLFERNNYLFDILQREVL